MNWVDGMGHMGYMWIWWLLGALVLIALVWAVVRAATPAVGATGAGRESPEQILKRRFAAGEIDREEYKARLNDLRD